jgi:hypothetical protein
MGGGRSDVGLSLRAEPRRGRGELDGDQSDVAVVSPGEKVHGAVLEQSLVVGAGFSQRSGPRVGVDRRRRTVNELDLAQGRDRIEVVEGGDSNIHVERRRGRPRGLGREHSRSPEAGVGQRLAEWMEIDVVDREPQGTISQQDGHQLAGKPDDHRGRVDHVGIDGQAMRWDKPH